MLMIKHTVWLAFWLIMAITVCLLPGPHWVEQKLKAAEAGIQPSESEKTVPDAEGILSQESGDRTVILKWLHAFFSENLDTKEKLGHVIPMVGVSFCFMMLVLGRRLRGPRNDSTGADAKAPSLSLMHTAGLILCSLLIVGFLSLGIELCQELLPADFHHGFSWDDVGASLCGGLIGASLGGLHAKSRPA